MLSSIFINHLRSGPSYRDSILHMQGFTRITSTTADRTLRFKIDPVSIMQSLYSKPIQGMALRSMRLNAKNSYTEGGRGNHDGDGDGEFKPNED